MIQSGVDAVSGGVRLWVEKVRATYALDNDPIGPGGKTTLPRLESSPDSTWAGADAAQSFIDRMHSELERDVHRFSMSLRLYIEDERTVEVLLKHVQDRIVDDWMDFSDLISNLYAGTMRSKAPTEEYVRAKLVRGSKEEWGPQSEGGVMRLDDSGSSSVTS